MGYRIEYESIGKIPRPPQKNRTVIFAAAAVILLVLCAITVKTVGLAFVREVLLPGDPDITAVALENMVADLREGEGFVRAFSAFCEVIIQNAPVE